MEFSSLEEFDRAFFAAYATQNARGATGYNYGAAPSAAYDPFLREAAPPRMAEPGRTQESGPLQILHAVVSYAIIALLEVAIIAFVAPLPFGVKLLNVETGSMQPDLPIGALIWVVPTKFEKISVGDDVTYKPPIGPYVTHRVIEIERENHALILQGIHDSVLAERVAYDQVQGVVRFHIHRIGPAMEKLSGEQGIYITIILILGIALLWGGSYLLSKMKARQSGKHG